MSMRAGVSVCVRARGQMPNCSPSCQRYFFWGWFEASCCLPSIISLKAVYLIRLCNGARVDVRVKDEICLLGSLFLPPLLCVCVCVCVCMCKVFGWGGAVGYTVGR